MAKKKAKKKTAKKAEQPAAGTVSISSDSAVYVFTGDPRGGSDPAVVTVTSRDSKRTYTFELNGKPVAVDEQDVTLFENNSHFS